MIRGNSFGRIISMLQITFCLMFSCGFLGTCSDIFHIQIVKRYKHYGTSRVAQMVKNLPANAGDPRLIPESRRSPGQGKGNPLQHYCLENPMDRGSWWATVHGGRKQLDTTEQLTLSFSLNFHICVCVLFEL